MRGRPIALVVLLGSTAAGCGTVPGTGSPATPECESGPRLAIVAQSVPSATYVPCIATLPTGWSFTELDVGDGGTTLSLESDRADHEVEVELAPSCDVADATPIAPSDEGVRTYQHIDSIDPRYVGTLLDVFPGGCVVTRYDFERGPHIALVTELQAVVDLYPRRQLRQELRAELEVTLDP